MAFFKKMRDFHLRITLTLSAVLMSNEQWPRLYEMLCPSIRRRGGGGGSLQLHYFSYLFHLME